MHQTFYSDSTNIPNVYDDSIFTPHITLYLQFFSFLYEKLFELCLKIHFFKLRNKHYFCLLNPLVPHPRRPNEYISTHEI